MTKPWIEKYRPETVEEVAGQNEITQLLSQFTQPQQQQQQLQLHNLPHLLFYGPPGTGKTSTILALAKQLYQVKSNEALKNWVLELNASDERGIDVIRKKVKLFARFNPGSGLGASSAGLGATSAAHTTPPPYKLIILDEADNLTVDSQTALRRIIEQYTSNTRFCLLCNYVSRIISPLGSRCAKFRFGGVGLDEGADRLVDICSREGLLAVGAEAAGASAEGTEGTTASEEARNQLFTRPMLRWLVKVSDGDLRRSIMFLQTIATNFTSNSNQPQNAQKDLTISADVLCDMVGLVPPRIINGYFELITTSSSSNNTKRSFWSNACKSWIDEVLLGGYSLGSIINQIVQWITSADSNEQLSLDATMMPPFHQLSHESPSSGNGNLLDEAADQQTKFKLPPLTPLQKALIIRACAQIERRCVCDGSDESVQIWWLVESGRRAIAS